MNSTSIFVAEDPVIDNRKKKYNCSNKRKDHWKKDLKKTPRSDGFQGCRMTRLGEYT